MQSWVLPLLGVCVIVFLVVLLLAVFFCYRKEADHKMTLSVNINDTGNLLRSDLILDRFILFGLNLESLIWNTEHNIVHTNRIIVYTRRFLNLCALFLFFFTIDLMDVIWANWCCYGDANPNTVILGTCYNASSPIRNSTQYEPCTRPTGWIWMANLAFVGSLILSLVLHLILWKRFVHDVKYDKEGQYTGLIDLVNNTKLVPQKELKYFKWYIWATLQHNEKNSFSTTQISCLSANLQRCSLLMMDVFAILFGLPHVVLSRTDLAMFHFLDVLLIIVTCVAYGFAGKAWSTKCCYYDSASASGRFGECTNATSIIALDPNRLSCNGTYSTEMIGLLWLLFIEILVMLLMWLYTFTMFHHLIHKQNKIFIEQMRTMVEAEGNKLYLKKFIAHNPHPSYGYE